MKFQFRLNFSSESLYYYSDYVYMDISNLIIYLILNKTIWLRCLHELLLE